MSAPLSPRLQDLIRDELHLPGFDFDGIEVASQVPGWDSLSHVSILAAVEQAYGIRIRALEAVRLKTLADLQALVDSKLGERAR